MSLITEFWFGLDSFVWINYYTCFQFAFRKKKRQEQLLREFALADMDDFIDYKRERLTKGSKPTGSHNLPPDVNVEGNASADIGAFLGPPILQSQWIPCDYLSVQDTQGNDLGVAVGEFDANGEIDPNESQD